MNSYINNDRDIISLMLNDLDEDQKEAVTSPLGDSLCLSSAGSGKTRVLTYRVAYLIAKGHQEGKMLLTFTNKAAEEMTRRVKGILGNDKINVLSGTFHHVAVIFLRKYSKVFNFNNNFNILTPEDSKDLLGVCRQNFLSKKDNDDIKKKFPSKAILYEIYSRSFNLNKSISFLNSFEYNFSDRIEKAIIEIIEDYNNRKKQNHSLDFDDILMYFYKLLRDYPKIREKISDVYPFILVDEYQDINWAQNNIIELLNQKYHYLMAVGDDSQSIYSFRGSKINYIYDFEKNHPNCNVYKIKYNYRSHKDIVDLTTDSINNNVQKYTKEMISFLPSFKKPVVIEAFNDERQAEYIADQIKKLYSEGIPYKEMAVLVRTNHLTKPFEMIFQKYNIPYKLVSGFSFFDREHVCDLLAFIKFFHNPYDESSFIRLSGLFNGIGAKTATTIYSIIRDRNFELDKVTEYDIPFKVNSKAYNITAELFDVLYKIYSIDSINEKLNTIMNIFYDDYMKFYFDDYYNRKKDVEILINSAKNYDNVSTFITDMVLDKSKEEKDNKDKKDVVVISTIHKAKGLEWNCVFIPYVNKDIFPSKKSVCYEDIEEERRLFYVAATRAKKYLFISYILYSIILGDSYSYYFTGQKSEFIREIDSKYYDFERIK